MRTKKWLLAAVAGAGAVLATGAAGVGPAAAAPAPAGPHGSLHVVDLGTLGGGSCCSFGTAISDTGVAVGSSSAGPDLFSPEHAFRWQAGHMTDLGTLGGDNSTAHAIDRRGDLIAGEADLASGETHAVLWRNGHAIDLGTLGGKRSAANGVNDAGVVVGNSQTASGKIHPFRWENGRMTDLDPTALNALANGINDRGEIVGERTVETTTEMTTEPVVWRRGVATVLPVPAGEFGATAQAIGEFGDIAGFTFGPNGNLAVRWTGRTVTKLGNLPGATSGAALGMNDLGTIVGFSDLDGFAFRGGRLTKLPSLATGSEALDVNNRGQIVGQSSTNSDNTEPRAVIWTY